jgi:hypothetical protein
MRHTRKRKRQLHSLDKYVIFSISVLLIYTIVALWASFRGVSNDTLTTCVFATWGGEILSCALIKIFKLKEENEKSEEADL